MSRRIIDWWRRRGHHGPRITTLRRYSSMAELPNDIARRRVAVAGTPEAWAAFECPCGTGHRILVRTRPHPTVPHWTITAGGNGLTAMPSFNYADEHRRCHFWLRDGRIVWVEREPRRRAKR